MLYSKAHNFIFVKTRKTAGSSIEVLLSQHMHDPADIITPLIDEDETTLRRPLGIEPRNHQDEHGLKKFWNHMPGRRIKKLLGREVWRTTLSISVERHPYEKAVSMAHFRQLPPGMSFEQHLDNVVRRGQYANWGIYTNRHGKPMVDVLIRFENLKAELDALLARLKLPPAAELPRAKTNFRTDRRPAAEVLSDEHKRIIQVACAPEFEYFGYEK